MATNNPILVPLKLDAFLINDAVLANNGTNVQRWKYFYPNLANFLSPAPAPFNYNANLTGTGTLLHWELPAIIRNGVQKKDSIEYPLVPNRWLVVRYSGPATARTAVAWIVQSDALGNSDPVSGGAPYIQPMQTALEPTYVGQVVALQNWNEPDPPTLFLKAIAPGNAMFASFQPFCQNVFSIYDPLTGVANQDTLSYLLAGWYSKPGDDITGSWQAEGIDFQTFLDEAGWKMASNPDQDSATRAIYHSMVWGMKWDKQGTAPSTIPNAAAAKVALGNTSVDALTTLIQAQANAAGKGKEIDASLLEALQYGLLPHYDQPDAQYQLKEDIEKSWFGASNGGYYWEIVEVPVDPSQGDPPPPVSAAEREKEAIWLANLNETQLRYDQDKEDLVQLQWNLYQTWWKYNNFLRQSNSAYPQGTSEAQFLQALNPDDPDSLISQVAALQEHIEEFAKDNTIPTGETQDQLQDAIDKYEQAMELPPTRQLKQLARHPFAKAYDPVVLIHGLNLNATLTSYHKRICRFMADLVTGFYYDSRPISLTDVNAIIPVPAGMTTVAAELQGLLSEFFLLDPDNATMITNHVLGSTDPAIIDKVAAAMLGGKAVEGTAPDLNLQEWEQPWAPLVMLWDIVWYPIPQSENGTPLWAFNGNDYTWNGNNLPNPVQKLEYTGSIFMTPQAGFNFKSQMEKYLRDNPDDTQLAALNNFIIETDSWDFLSQSLAGLTPAMTLRDPRPNISPSIDQSVYYSDKTLSDLVGNSANYVPVPGLEQPPPFSGFPPSGFQTWRAGQFYIKQLVIADRFGQLCEIVTNKTEQGLQPLLPDSLTPQFPVIPNQPYRFVQLPPRILQPARLNVDFISGSSDTGLAELNKTVNPVCAWLLHNYLDKSIEAYDNTGAVLGAVWVVTNTGGQQTVEWFAAPDSAYKTIPDLLTVPGLENLGKMLEEIKTLGPNAFRSLIELIDNASWTIDAHDPTSDQGLILLAGKPVALVRMQLSLELEGAALTDPSWRFTFAPDTNPVTTYPFNVRLGEEGKQSDGLIGYYIESDYSKLYAPQVPEGIADPDYVEPVGTGSSISLSFNSDSAIQLSVLMDPRALVHATTGILPVISMGIPSGFVGAAFAKMEVSFRVGPLLTNAVQPQSETGDDMPSYSLPKPALKVGTWAWQQVDAGEWKTYAIAPTNDQANFSNLNPVLREGVLRLTDLFKKILPDEQPAADNPLPEPDLDAGYPFTIITEPTT